MKAVTLMAKALWGRLAEVRLFRENGETLSIKAIHTHSSFAIHFTIPFGDISTSQVSTVTIMNLSKAHRNMFHKGLKVQVFAGYEDDNGLKLISEGAIVKVNPYVQNGADEQFSFTFNEGQFLLNAKFKKHTNLSFGRGAKASTIIKQVANDANIKISKLRLNTDKKFKKGYVAKGKPLDIIKKLVTLCDSQCYQRLGKFIIDDLSNHSGKNEHIMLSMRINGQHGGSGLVEHVTINEDQDSPDTISFKSFLRNQITTGSLITIDDSPFFAGTRRVRSGEHNCDDDAFTTTGEVYANDQK
jgi:hypothetical protein